MANTVIVTANDVPVHELDLGVIGKGLKDGSGELGLHINPGMVFDKIYLPYMAGDAHNSGSATVRVTMRTDCALFEMERFVCTVDLVLMDPTSSSLIEVSRGDGKQRSRHKVGADGISRATCHFISNEIRDVWIDGFQNLGKRQEGL